MSLSETQTSKKYFPLARSVSGYIVAIGEWICFQNSIDVHEVPYVGVIGIELFFNYHGR